jgi:hypothetical protein
MLPYLILSVILYLGWVLLYYHRGKIKKNLFQKTTSSPFGSIPDGKNDEIMGKTKTLLSQVKTNNDTLRQNEKPIKKPFIFAPSNEKSNPATIENSELDSIFSDTPELLELDIDLEFGEEEFVEDESLYLPDDESVEPATGIRYDEMDLLVRTLKQSRELPQTEQNAVNTILRINETELFHMLVAQINGGKQRVADMLDKYKATATDSAIPNSDQTQNDFQQFEINDFL